MIVCTTSKRSITNNKTRTRGRSIAEGKRPRVYRRTAITCVADNKRTTAEIQSP